MQVKYKLLHLNAVAPRRMTKGSAAFDLVAVEVAWLRGARQVTYNTQVAVEIPEGYVGLLVPRSSVFKTDLYSTNGVGVIDSDYRGPLKIKYNIKVTGAQRLKMYKKGDRVAQLLIVPIAYVTFVKSYELSETERDSGGFGSTD